MRRKATQANPGEEKGRPCACWLGSLVFPLRMMSGDHDKVSKLEEQNPLDSEQCFVLMYNNFNIPTMKY